MCKVLSFSSIALYFYTALSYIENESLNEKYTVLWRALSIMILWLKVLRKLEKKRKQTLIVVYTNKNKDSEIQIIGLSQPHKHWGRYSATAQLMGLTLKRPEAAMLF